MLSSRSSGVALLQVLLISSVISLLAIRFTHTAREQVDIASQFDQRVGAQLAAYSAFNEIIFIQLSESIEVRRQLHDRVASHRLDRSTLNYHGEPVIWRNGVTVVMQDLNGLLPQIFPTHFLWSELLSRRSLSNTDIAAYLGVWQDLQDVDRKAWSAGDAEPNVMPGGGTYPNGYAQSSKILEWVFSDRPALLANLLQFSDINAVFDTNLLNSPKVLLESLFAPHVAAAIGDLRQQPQVILRNVLELLPHPLRRENLTVAGAGRLKIEVLVDIDGAHWREQRTVMLSASSKPPFNVILNN